MQQETELVVYFSAVEQARSVLLALHMAQLEQRVDYALQRAADRVRKAVEEAQED